MHTPAISNFVVNKFSVSTDRGVGKKIRLEILQKASINKDKTNKLSAFYRELGFNMNTHIYVINANEFNAFSLPDNSIFVYDRVLDEVKSYPELAALLAHEYVHIRERHGMKKLAHSMLLQILFSGADPEALISKSNTLLELKNSKNFEIEADKGGMELMLENRIDLNGMIELFKRMIKFDEENQDNLPSYLSTHPDSEDRLIDANKRAEEMGNNYIHDEKLENLFLQLKQG